MPCPTFESLIDFTDNKLAPNAAGAVLAHVGTGCGSCESTLDWYRGFTVTASSDLVEPPVWLTRKAVALFAVRQKEGVVSKVTRFVASLVFDSFASASTPDFVPARSATVSGRQLLFTASPYDVDLLVSGGDGPHTVAVHGQVLAAESDEVAAVSGLGVEFLLDDRIVAAAVTTEFGEFAVDSIRPGTYDIRLSGHEREILLTSVPVEFR